MKLGGGVLATGHLLAGLATLVLIGGIYSLLRALGVDSVVAICSALLVLAVELGQNALLTIRGDVLAAALNMWGLVAISRRKLWPAAALFTLAWAGKPTTISGIAAALGFLLLSGRQNDRKAAWRLGGLMAFGYATVLGVMHLASGGAALQILQASSGANLWDIMRTPYKLFVEIATCDAGARVSFVLAASTFLVSSKRDLAGLFFLAAIGGTALVLAAPLTSCQHLLELHTASIIFFSIWLTRTDGRREFGLAVLVVFTALALGQLAERVREQSAQPPHSWRKQVVEVLGRNPGPILSEDPLVPILAGQRPYVLDSFVFRILSHRDPSFARPLWERLRGRSFDAIVLVWDVDTEQARSWYETRHFGKGFLEEVKQNYELARVVGPYFVYRPRSRNAESLSRLLETVRQDGQERLQESEEEAATRGKHRDWYLELAEQADWELHGPRQNEWRDGLEIEHDNLRAALAWSTTAVWRGYRVTTIRASGLVHEVRLYGAAERLREVLGVAIAPADRADYDRNVGSARAVPGEKAFKDRVGRRPGDVAGAGG
ncbi:MAG: hypothetical protein ACRDGN_04910 [bacterium]